MYNNNNCSRKIMHKICIYIRNKYIIIREREGEKCICINNYTWNIIRIKQRKDKTNSE